MAKDKDKFGPGFVPPKPVPLNDLMFSLTQAQRDALKEAMKAGKKGYTYDHKTGQYGFKFKDGGAVCRGQGSVSRQRRFRVT